jgi:uncharacterized OB-fold protein
VVNYGPSGFENDAPYILALAEFDEGIQILARLSRDIKENDVKIGMNLTVNPAKLAEGRIAYEFRRA